MNERDHVVFGSLLHDIGKFFERAETLTEHAQNKEELQRYCETNSSGSLDFFHVLGTYRFCEKLIEQLTILKSSARDYPNQHWAELASHHHSPPLAKDSYLKRVVEAADCFASAEREQGDFYAHDIHKKTRLESLLGRISLTNHNKEASHFLPLSALALVSQAIYPQSAQVWDMAKQACTKDNVWLAQAVLTNEYKQMADSFLSDLTKFPNFEQSTPESLRAVVRTLLSLMENYLSQIPAATNVLRPDISLFDHLRITAAIAEGLYVFHADNDTLASSDLTDQQTSKWLLVCGDFSGIQNFIYKITSKGAAKGLRGRSFFLQLLCDAACEQIIHKLALYPTSRIYSSGGKFYLLIAATQIKALQQEVEAINQALLQQFRGEMTLGIGVAAIKAEDFQEGNMGKRWKEVNDDLMKNRQQPFIAQVTEDISCFAPEALHTEGACQVCDRDDKLAGIRLEVDNDTGDEFRICSQCKELREIGRVLADTNYLFWVWREDREKVEANLNTKAYLRYIDLCGTDCRLYFLKQIPEFDKNIRLYNCHLESLNAIIPPNANAQGYSVGFRFVGKWQRDKASGNYEFNDFAEQSPGIKRMGVLRMDVDNLGEIFISGLTFKNPDANAVKTMGSLSRIATLSRQLHLFFAGYLPTLVSTKFPNSQVIYAGGDDVFIIGSWDELPLLAQTIRNEFKRYCANNEDFTISGGITLVGGKYPISKAATLAGEAESLAKQLKRGDKKSKDALCFLDTAIGWESFDNAVQLKDKICNLTDKTQSHAIIDRLRQVVMATNKLNQQLPAPTEDFIYWNKWRWRLIYNLKRMADRYTDLEIKTELKELEKILITPTDNKDQQSVLDYLQMPVRLAEFLKRRNDDA